MTKQQWEFPVKETFAVRLNRLGKALDLAAELMRNSGYPPNTRKKSIVQWKEEEDSEHSCEICFQSSISISSYGSGYIEVRACACKERWAFKEIVSNFGRELSQRGWLETFQRYAFNSTGVP